MENLFTHLHLHSWYSLNDAMISPKKLAKRCKELGMKKVAVTDHGVMFDIPLIYQELKKEGIELIVGTEAYVAPRSNRMKQPKLDDANYHLVLLCKDEEGYNNLIKIMSDAAQNGFYYRARTDKRTLRKHSKGLIALSACLGGELLKTLRRDGYEAAKKVALEYLDIFGEGNYYIEIQDHGMIEQKETNPLLIRLSEETGIPLVCTNDCHYINNNSYNAHDTLMAIQAGTTRSDTKRKKYPSDQFYVKSQEEMISIFEDTPEAIKNTMEIANKCHVEFDFGTNKLPPFHIPDYYNGTNEDFLRERMYEGLNKKYKTLNDEIIDRAEYELGVVKKMGYINYFLIVWDFFRFCKEGTEEYGDPIDLDWEPILCGPGRGSGAGSILSYSLDITKIDPLQYDLIFERFLDVSRVSMPD